MRALAFLHLWQGRELGRVKQHVLGRKAKDLHVYSKPSKLKLAFSCSFFVFHLATMSSYASLVAAQMGFDEAQLVQEAMIASEIQRRWCSLLPRACQGHGQGFEGEGPGAWKGSRAWRWQLPIPLFDQECRADEIDLGSVMHVRVIVYQQLLANRAYYKDFVAEYMSDFLHNTLQHGTWRDDVTLQASCLRWKCFSSLFLVMRVKPPLFPSYALYIRIKSTLFFLPF